MSHSPRDPLVTIVTPCLNPGDWLQRCIDSVRRQTYPNIEHIVVDGGSTDGTRELLSALEDIRWVSEPDAGQSNALNKGFAMARGDIVGWLNADDEFLPDAIEQVAGCFRDGSVAWSYGDCEMVYEDKKQLWVGPARVDPGSFDWKMPFAQQGWFFTKAAFEQVGPLDESFDLAMDFDLCIRLQMAGLRSCRVPRTLARFVIHSGSKTGQRNYAEFIREGARALLKAGRVIPYYAALGQSCAYASAIDGRVSRATLRTALQKEHSQLGAVESCDWTAVRAGALTAAAQIEAKSSRAPLAALRWLFDVAPWRFGLTRALLPNVIKTSLVRWGESSWAGPIVARMRKLL